MRGFLRRFSLVAALVALGLAGLAQYALAKGRVRPALIGYGAAAILFVAGLRSCMPNGLATDENRPSEKESSSPAPEPRA